MKIMILFFLFQIIVNEYNCMGCNAVFLRREHRCLLRRNLEIIWNVETGVLSENEQVRSYSYLYFKELLNITFSALGFWWKPTINCQIARPILY